MGKLILVRHGQSIWNLENRFTGWIDIPLSEKGHKEAKKAGKLLSNIKFDSAFTSTLQRAEQTMQEILKVSEKIKSFRYIHEDKLYNKFSGKSPQLEIKRSSALNERHYGDLQGLNKDETRKKYGDNQVKLWRRSFDIAPPNGESLEMTAKRTLPYYKKQILPLLKKGQTILITAHGNSLRALIMHIEKLSKEQILETEVATGVPIVYNFKEGRVTRKKILK